MCLQNLIDTADHSQARITFLHDAYHPAKKEHFVNQQNRFPVVEIQEGTETGSFLKLLDFVKQQRFSPETILYFVEDDYWHRDGWVDVLLEGFTIEDADYITLYDHKDKYFHPNYTDLKSKIAHTQSCHWRSTPSTTNTYATKMKTLMRDFDLHREFSLDRTITDDHGKFCCLAKHGATLYSSIPGWSSHLEPDFLSPCVAWEYEMKRHKHAKK